MSDEFVDSIGVATHFNFSGTAYENYPLINDKLSALGVRHVRDRAYLNPHPEFNQRIYSRYKDLATLGIKFNLTVDPRTQNLQSVDKEKIAAIAEMAGASLGSFAGPNEYNKSGDPDRAATLTSYQRNLYAAVKNNPSTADMPVVGPALGKPYPNEKPDLSAYLDYGNVPPYPGCDYPSSWGLDNFNLPAARAVSAEKPLIATETGYHNATKQTFRPGVSETAAAKYMPRLYFEYFNREIVRAYAYEFYRRKA